MFVFSIIWCIPLTGIRPPGISHHLVYPYFPITCQEYIPGCQEAAQLEGWSVSHISLEEKVVQLTYINRPGVAGAVLQTPLLLI